MNRFSPLPDQGEMLNDRRQDNFLVLVYLSSFLLQPGVIRRDDQDRVSFQHIHIRVVGGVTKALSWVNKREACPTQEHAIHHAFDHTRGGFIGPKPIPKSESVSNRHVGVVGLVGATVYSRFRALTGSTFAARLAGQRPASRETTAAPASNKAQPVQSTEKTLRGIISSSSGSLMSSEAK